MFAEPRSGVDYNVQKKVEALSDVDFIRLPAFAERKKIQKDRFRLPLFPTTTIGSFPQTPDVRTTRAAFRKGEISEEQYDTYMKEKISECVKLQVKIGLDVLVHGEFERNEMVEYFGECLNGLSLQKKHGYSLMVHAASNRRLYGAIFPVQNR